MRKKTLSPSGAKGSRSTIAQDRREGSRAPHTTRGRVGFFAIGTMLIVACGGEPLPEVPLDLGTHDDCSDSIPHAVDASASEIQCFIEDYITQVEAGMVAPPTPLDVFVNEPGDPICCEVCAQKDSADEACDAMCNWLACDRARDDHLFMGNVLGMCKWPNCGFDFEMCLRQSAAHQQTISLFNGDLDFYLLTADCEAHATDPARPDGLFEYLEGLDGVPNARGVTAEVTDVVQWCLDKVGSATGSAAPSTTDDGGADTTAGTGGGSVPDPPRRCGPWAMERAGANPSDNFGTWNGLSEAVGSDGTSTVPVTIIGGGIEYSVMPCGGGISQDCVRVDRISVRSMEPGSMIGIDLNLVERSELLPLSQAGYAIVPRGALRLAARYVVDGSESLIEVSNAEDAPIRIDDLNGEVQILDLLAVDDGGELTASLSLSGDRVNSQPRPQIVITPGSAWNELVLSASTFDAESDPIAHRWMVLGQGTWTGDAIDIVLPPGRHAVVLYADDVHKARGIAATWVEVDGGGSP